MQELLSQVYIENPDIGVRLEDTYPPRDSILLLNHGVRRKESIKKVKIGKLVRPDNIPFEVWNLWEKQELYVSPRFSWNLFLYIRKALDLSCSLTILVMPYYQIVIYH